MPVAILGIYSLKPLIEHGTFARSTLRNFLVAAAIAVPLLLVVLEIRSIERDLAADNMTFTALGILLGITVVVLAILADRKKINPYWVALPLRPPAPDTAPLADGRYPVLRSQEVLRIQRVLASRRELLL